MNKIGAVGRILSECELKFGFSEKFGVRESSKFVKITLLD